MTNQEFASILKGAVAGRHEDLEIILEAQERFQNKMEVCRLMNYHRQPNN